MSYRLLVTDLDGTLLDRSGRIHESDRQAVRALERRGVRVSFATGRMYSGARHLAQELALGGPLGCVDGSHVVDVTTERELCCHSLDGERLTWLFELLAAGAQACFVFADDGIVFDERGAAFVPYMSVWSLRTTRSADVFGDGRFHEPCAVTAVVALGAREAMTRADAAIRARSEAFSVMSFAVHRTEFRGMWGLIVRTAGVDKASAVAQIAAHHGVSLADTITVGDWTNDVPMLRVAGRSFAMGHAPPEVKACATDQLEADADSGGGIREAAERAGLL